MSEPRLLLPNETVDEHPITDVDTYRSDIALLNYLLQDLRVLIRRYDKDEIDLEPQQVLTWDVHGLERRTVVCDPAGLRGREDVQIVGFFGDRRRNADQPAIDASEFDLISEFRSYPGILSYSSLELVDHYWANLVVHRDPGDREAWRSSSAHIHAVDHVAPIAYHAVRIHNGCIPEGIYGPQTVVLESTKYWDYDVAPTWHAVRLLPGGETTELAGPTLDPPRPHPSDRNRT
jgi:hypothetical protein